MHLDWTAYEDLALLYPIPPYSSLPLNLLVLVAYTYNTHEQAFLFARSQCLTMES
jgi:hypothetical protein